MRLPAELQQAIEEEAARVDRGQRLLAARELSERYQRGNFASPVMETAAHAIAYLQTRLPATYAAQKHVFAAVGKRLPDLKIESLLDLGAGPGTAMWAAVESFPDIRKFIVVERDARMVELGRRLAGRSRREELSRATWVTKGVTQFVAPPNDLVVISYVLGELSPAAAAKLVAEAWRAAQKLLVIIEPGTPRNFQIVLAARQALIEAGAWIIAPCPHHQACPMAPNDWCHFAARVERTATHRRLKGGVLGYEDEKFSYVAASRIQIEWPRARIVRHPLFRPGHIQLTLCTPPHSAERDKIDPALQDEPMVGRLEKETVAKSAKERYRLARKAEWGDEWD